MISLKVIVLSLVMCTYLEYVLKLGLLDPCISTCYEDSKTFSSPFIFGQSAHVHRSRNKTARKKEKNRAKPKFVSGMGDTISETLDVII